MWSYHPLERHVCVVLLFLGGIATFVSLRNRNNQVSENLSNETDTVQISENYLLANQKHFVKEPKVFKSFKNYFNVGKLKSNSKNYENEIKEINILGLFELSTKWGKREEGFSEMAAARLAIEHVNKLAILPGYFLKLITNDTKVKTMYFCLFSILFNIVSST